MYVSRGLLFSEVEDWEGPAFQTCMDAAMVSRAFETSRRREVLSFTHHREVAPLSADWQDKLLDEAEMWEISENLHRAELTVVQRSEQVSRWVELSDKVLAQLEPKPQGGRPESGDRKAARELNLDRNEVQRAMHIAERKRLYEDAHPEMKNGGGAKGVRGKPDRQVGELDKPERFTADTAEKTGTSERAVQRSQAHALAIRARAEMRLAEEYDIAQRDGELRKQGERSNLSDGKVSTSDVGLSYKEVYEARKLRDAERDEPGIV